MAVFKCKMCGANLNIAEDTSTTLCEYCGSMQTVPKVDDEKKLALFTRANRLRAACEFDKASGIFEAIIADFPEEAEAYWGLVLCKYGIEYVDDPATGKKVPTCHRSSFESVMKDQNVELAMEYADMSAKILYREEAKQIEELRKQIISVSANEAPYDIFISYKEKGFDGNRTLDSVLAQDLYDALTDKGYRVFFSRISLEDKLGTEYEPYIFAALNSAKLMLVVGTRFEHFDAVWVKNEWSRFLKLMTQDKTKHLIPCFKGIDAYDMPEEFARLQAQDLGKMGADQDILRGVEKLLPKEKAKKTVALQSTSAARNPTTDSYLTRAFMFLEDGDWKKANEYCEKVLDIDPECARAYLGKLMADLEIRTKDDLADYDEPFNDNSNFEKALRFADERLRNDLLDSIEHIKTRNELARMEGIFREATEGMSEATEENAYIAVAEMLESISGYKNADALALECRTNANKCVYIRAKSAMISAKDEESYIEAASLFEAISEYEDAADLAQSCLEKAETVRKDAIYENGISKMLINSITQQKKAVGEFMKIPGWKDADEKIALCNQKIAEIRAQQEKDKKKSRRKFIISLIVPFAIVAVIVLVVLFLSNKASNLKTRFEEVEVGGYVVFGSYEQDNNESNGKEPIEWLVLAKEGSKVLVISRYALDYMPFESKDISPHTWLKENFVKEAFSLMERGLISSEADPRSNYDINKEVFFLSPAAARDHFPSNNARICKPTAYAVAQGVTEDPEGNCCWWLDYQRLNDLGYINDTAYYVNSLGQFSTIDGYDGLPTTSVIYRGDGSIRPAMWIDLSGNGIF